MEGRSAPWNETAEQSVLGAMLCNPQAIPVAAELLTGSDFFRQTDSTIFQGIVAMWLKDEGSVDTVTVGSLYPDHREYISYLADRCPVAANIKHYAEIVKKDATARALIRAGQEIAELGYQGEVGTAQLLDTAESKLVVLRPDSQKNLYKVADLGQTVVNRLQSGKKPQRISTGFNSIDQYTKGFYAGNFIIIGARPGVGKTMLALTMAYRAAKNQPVVFFSLEMKAEELMERLLASIACVSLTRIRENNLTPEELEALYQANEETAPIGLSIVDDSSLTMLSLASRVRTLSKTKRLGLVVVDYLQLMTMGARSENRREEVSEISRRLKTLAMEVNVPIVALSQLNRMSTFDGGGVDISQLKESGSLEQDADCVILLDHPKQDQYGGQKTIDVKIGKNRHGPLGEANLVWLPQYCRLEE